MFVEASPGDKLLKLFRQIENTHKISEDFRIKFVSKSGVKLSNIVSKKDPFFTNCEDENCIPAKNATNEGRKLDCKKMNICYKAECKDCKLNGKRKVYYGETYRNLHMRSSEHYKNCGDEDEKNSWMKQHMINDHADKQCDFSWSIVNSFKKPILRQLTEAVNINNTVEKEQMNLKSEYFVNNINKIKLNYEDTNNFTCKICGRKFRIFHEMKKHMHAFHERLDCKNCVYKSIGAKDMELHMKHYHVISTENED